MLVRYLLPSLGDNFLLLEAYESLLYSLLNLQFFLTSLCLNYLRRPAVVGDYAFCQFNDKYALNPLKPNMIK